MERSRRLLDSTTAEHLRRAKKLGFSDRQLARRHGVTETEIRAQRKAAGVIPTYRLVDTCAAEFEAYTPYYYSTYGDENEMRAERQAQDHDPRRRTEPHRPGDRVRLLLRPRRVRAARARLRDHHGQLESGNGFDRLRHERQTLLRAAHARRRAQHLRAGKAGRRHRAVRRANAAESRGRLEGGRRSDHRHAAGKHRDGGRPQALRRDARQTRACARRRAAPR